MYSLHAVCGEPSAFHTSMSYNNPNPAAYGLSLPCERLTRVRKAPQASLRVPPRTYPLLGCVWINDKRGATPVVPQIEMSPPTTTMWIPTDHHHHMSGLVIPTTLVAITAQVTRRCPQHLTRHRQTKSCQHPPEGTPTGSHRQPQS